MFYDLDSRHQNFKFCNHRKNKNTEVSIAMDSATSSSLYIKCRELQTIKANFIITINSNKAQFDHILTMISILFIDKVTVQSLEGLVQENCATFHLNIKGLNITAAQQRTMMSLRGALQLHQYQITRMAIVIASTMVMYLK